MLLGQMFNVKFRIMLILVISVLVSGCSKQEDITSVNASMVPYKICSINNKKLAPLEQEICMSGAYIQEDIPYTEIKAFEQKINAINNIYINRINKDDDFPVDFVVDCIAKDKIPLLRVSSEISYNDVMTIALTCGNLNLPMFIELDYNDEIEKYNSHSELFRGYAPKVALVYGFNIDKESYELPNNELYDWVSINASENMTNGTIDSNFLDISRWCNIYKDKSIMISIAIPIFSTNKCNYAIDEACKELENIYNLSEMFNNIGSINYYSYVLTEDDIRTFSSRLSESEKLLQKYGEVINNLPKKRYYNDTPYVGYVINDKIYVTRNVANNLGLKGVFGGYSDLMEVSEASFDKDLRKIFVK